MRKKICLLGDFFVGKSSLIRRFALNRFDDEYVSTVGTHIYSRSIPSYRHTDNQVELLAWDLAGAESLEQVPESYFYGATGAILVCDLSRVSTLRTVQECAKIFLRINPGVPLVIVGNKADLSEERVITDEALHHIAREFAIPYYLTSAKTGENVSVVFQTLVQTICNKAMA